MINKSIFKEVNEDVMKKLNQEPFNTFVESIKENIEPLKNIEGFYEEYLNNNIEKRKHDLNPNNMSCHKPFLGINEEIDLSEALKNLIGLDKERMMIISVDIKNKCVEDFLLAKEGTTISCNSDSNTDLIEWISAKYKKNNDLKFVVAHNHPDVIVANPSTGDHRMFLGFRIVCTMIGTNLLDSFVITDYDCYSEYQWGYYKAEKKKYTGYASLSNEDKAKLENIDVRIKALEFLMHEKELEEILR